MKSLAIFSLLAISSVACAQIDPHSYGAQGDGQTDDAAALQAACNAAQASNGYVVLGNAYYAISQPVVANCDIQGQSEQRSKILLTNSSANGLVVTSDAPVHYSNFGITGHQSAGAAIYIAPSSGINQNSTFERIYMINVWDGIRFTSGSWWRIENCTVSGYGQYGIYVSDVLNPDDDDPTITGCTIRGTNGAAAIYQASGGGLRIINNKLVGGHYGYYLALVSGAMTGETVISGNSIEGFFTCIAFTCGANSQFLNSVITGNEMACNNPKYSNGLGIVAMSNGTIWFTGLTISGNTIYLGEPNSIAIDLNGVSGASIVGNTIIDSYPPNYGVVLGAQTQFCSVNSNGAYSLTTPVVNQGVQNAVQ